MIRLLITFIALSLLLRDSAEPLPTPPATKPTRILIISLDGARPDAILQVETPHIDALAERGAVTWTASTVFPPATLPAHASMLTGFGVLGHGVTWNGTLARCPPIETPTVLLHAVEAGYKTAIVAGKEKFCHFVQRPDISFTFARQGDRSVVDRVLELLDEGYEVIFAQFPNPDFFGHRDGWMSDMYLYELRNTDRQLGRILEQLDDETLVILTADHGGHDKLHGLPIPEDMHIPWIIAGPGVIPRTHLGDEINITDTAATLFWLMEWPMPAGISGRPVVEVFDFSDSTLAGCNGRRLTEV